MKSAEIEPELEKGGLPTGPDIDVSCLFILCIISSNIYPLPPFQTSDSSTSSEAGGNANHTHSTLMKSTKSETKLDEARGPTGPDIDVSTPSRDSEKEKNMGGEPSRASDDVSLFKTMFTRMC